MSNCAKSSQCNVLHCNVSEGLCVLCASRTGTCEKLRNSFSAALANIKLRKAIHNGAESKRFALAISLKIA